MFTSMLLSRVFLVRERFVIYVSKRCIRKIIYCYSRSSRSTCRNAFRYEIEAYLECTISFQRV